MGAKDTGFLAITDWDTERLQRALELAQQLKRRHRAGDDPAVFAGRHLALIFQKPSLRTRLSFEVGFAQLGGNVTYTYRLRDVNRDVWSNEVTVDF